jgi:hypothetical protein
MCYIQCSLGPRTCRTEILPQSLSEPAPRRPPTHTSDSVPIDVHHTPTSFQFRFLHTYMRMHLYVRCISFTWDVCIPEYYHCSLIRVLRDVDLHRPATRRRRCVELSNSRTHSRPRHISVVPPTHTEQTHVCSRIQRNHHCRDCLYNIKHIIQNINT